MQAILDALKSTVGLNLAQGYKTYIWAAVTVAVAACSFFGIGDVAPSVVNHDNALTWVWQALAVVFIRKAVAPTA